MCAAIAYRTPPSPSLLCTPCLHCSLNICVVIGGRPLMVAGKATALPRVRFRGNGEDSVAHEHAWLGGDALHSLQKPPIRLHLPHRFDLIHTERPTQHGFPLARMLALLYSSRFIVLRWRLRHRTNIVQIAVKMRVGGLERTSSSGSAGLLPLFTLRPDGRKGATGQLVRHRLNDVHRASHALQLVSPHVDKHRAIRLTSLPSNNFVPAALMQKNLSSVRRHSHARRVVHDGAVILHLARAKARLNAQRITRAHPDGETDSTEYVPAAV
mmetsp:Transcript_30399/g.54433  ORF Transcript_30399/g.54433 Transcript_30399/m.54433 type:complete len:269 (-) Transcript_30399:1666-2472(-)